MLLPISNTPRGYSWGSASLIAELEGRAPSGAPEAESWYGDYAGSPSIVDDGTGRTLDVALAEAGEPALPYLMKLLAAASTLSIQAHPTKEQAVAGFAHEEARGIPRDAADRLYRDDNHKPEIIVALSGTFRALLGLRSLPQTRRLVDALGDGPGARALAGRLNGDDESAVLRDALAWALSGSAPVAEIAAELAAAASPEFTGELEVLCTIAAAFPGDPGLVVALLMNLVVLQRGEAVFAPAGVLHAYQDGLGVELMAASDNVLRGGLTRKHIDVPELLRIVDTTPGPVPLVAARWVAPGVEVFEVDVPDFALTRVTVVGVAIPLTLMGPAIVLAVRGTVEVAAGAASVVLVPGRAAYLSARDGDAVLTGSGEAFVATPGRR
ncbi:mannose-6-phosphate isomerase, class I [Microbacterium sp.]|uniref:mannose-6-phosphate isomerase, class I n=1 Tax=Microbacterium sp. TaxID=51671 RepID=UPI0025F57DE5|nr:mannose-6-phosphate isomerase, class I [Microbacterium sp.]